MSAALERYRDLERELREKRILHGPGSEAEDPIIETMTDIWWLLTDDEQTLVDAEPPQCWPRLETCTCGAVANLSPRKERISLVVGAVTELILWRFDPHNAPCGNPCLCGLYDGHLQVIQDIRSVHGSIVNGRRQCPAGCYK